HTVSWYRETELGKLASSTMGGVRQQLMAAVLVAVALMATAAEGYITQKTWGAIRRANRAGPFVGLVVPNTYEMVPVLESPSFVASKSVPNMDIQGRRFRFGTIEGQSVVMVMTGLSMLNAGLTTQMLLSLFRVKGIVHWGIAGNANEDLQIGDVTIPEYWAHVSLWNWQVVHIWY
uniref:Nucleoside phosphorylase domain-containing protein n=1 Tax=Aegilops tauschii subsp. strangulata TaxID=200361 RepID=A0A453EI18_AEGTS